MNFGEYITLILGLGSSFISLNKGIECNEYGYFNFMPLPYAMGYCNTITGLNVSLPTGTNGALELAAGPLYFKAMCDNAGMGYVSFYDNANCDGVSTTGSIMINTTTVPDISGGYMCPQQNHDMNDMGNNMTYNNMTNGNMTYGNMTNGNMTHGNMTNGNMTQGNMTNGNMSNNMTNNNQTQMEKQCIAQRIIFSYKNSSNCAGSTYKSGNVVVNWNPNYYSTCNAYASKSFKFAEAVGLYTTTIYDNMYCQQNAQTMNNAAAFQQGCLPKPATNTSVESVIQNVTASTTMAPQTTTTTTAATTAMQTTMAQTTTLAAQNTTANTTTTTTTAAPAPPVTDDAHHIIILTGIVVAIITTLIL